MSDDVTKVVTWLFEAFNEGDLERAATTVSNDFELVDVAAGQTFRGPDGCRQWLEIFRTALPDARTEIVNLFTDGVRVASEHIRGFGVRDTPPDDLRVRRPCRDRRSHPPPAHARGG